MTEERYSQWKFDALDRRLREVERRIGFGHYSELEQRLRKLEDIEWRRGLDAAFRRQNVILGAVYVAWIVFLVIAIRL